MALDSKKGEILHIDTLRENEFLAGVPWGTRGGGREFKYEEMVELEKLWSKLLSSLNKSEVGVS
jgi:hypothetical protein